MVNVRAVLVVAGLVAFWGYGAARERAGRTKERSRVAAARVDTATIEVRRTDTVYRDRLRTLTQTLTLYDSARVTDTIMATIRDTVRVFVTRDAADSAVSMCRLTVFACDRRVAAGDSLTAALRRQLTAIENERPGFLEQWGGRILWAGFGAGVVAIAK